MGVAMTDLSTGLYAYGAILAALLHKQKTGLGQHVDCSLLNTQVGLYSDRCSISGEFNPLYDSPVHFHYALDCYTDSHSIQLAEL